MLIVSLLSFDGMSSSKPVRGDKGHLSAMDDGNVTTVLLEVDEDPSHFGLPGHRAL